MYNLFGDAASIVENFGRNVGIFLAVVGFWLMYYGVLRHKPVII